MVGLTVTVHLLLRLSVLSVQPGVGSDPSLGVGARPVGCKKEVSPQSPTADAATTKQESYSRHQLRPDRPCERSSAG